MEKIIEEIKRKKEFNFLNNEVVRENLNEVLRQNPKLNEFLNRERSEGFKKIVKLAREKLHRAYGVFQKEDKEKANDLIKNLSKAKDESEFQQIHNELLSLTLSTKERMPFYHELYTKIFEITGWPKSILDIGCGFNPMSFPFMRLEELDYYAYDINEEDIMLLNKYFDAMGDDLNGKAKQGSFDEKNLPSADVCFLFKVLDILDRKGHKKSEELIKNLKCKYIVASFSTVTVSGKRMKHSYRGWMNRMLNRLRYKFKILEFENEVFYVVKK